MEDGVALINPQSEIRIPQSRGTLAAGGTDLLLVSTRRNPLK